MIAGLIPAVSSFVTLPIFSRYLTPEEYGLLTLIFTLSAFLPILFTFQLSTAVVRFFYEFESGIQRIYFTTNLVVVFIVGGCSLFLLELYLPSIIRMLFPKTGPEYYSLFAVGVITSFLSAVNLLSSKFLIVQEKARLYLVLVSCGFVLKLVALLTMVVGFGLGPTGMVYGNLFGAAVTGSLFLLANKCLLSKRINFKLLKEPLLFALPTIPINLSMITIAVSDRVILEKHVDLAVIGIYAMGDSIANALKMLVEKFNLAFQPHFMRVSLQQGVVDGIALLKHVSLRIFFLMGFLVCIAVLFSPELLNLFVDSRFYGAWVFISIISTAILLKLLYSLNSIILLHEKKTGRMAVVTVSAGLLNLTINIAFVPKYGAITVAWSTFASCLLLSISVFFTGYRERSKVLVTVRNLSIIIYSIVILSLGLSINSNLQYMSKGIYFDSTIAIKISLLAPFLAYGIYFHRRDFCELIVLPFNLKRIYHSGFFSKR